MKKIALALLATLVFLPGVVEAASISLYRRDSTISPVETSVEDTVLFNEAPDTLEIPLLFSAHTFEASSTLSEHSCSIEEKDYGSLITCDLPEGEGGRLSLDFITNEIVRHTGEHYYFEDDLNAPYYTEDMVYNARLEEGYVLIDGDMDTPFPVFSPGYGQEGSDGRRIYVIWSTEDIDEGDGIRTRLSFERTEEPEEGFGEVYIVGIGVALVLALLLIGSSLGKEEEGIPQALKDDERKIMEIVESSGGEIKQKRIVDNVEFSKAKVSRLIHDLKERGLLETKKVGRTNRVRLKNGE